MADAPAHRGPVRLLGASALAIAGYVGGMSVLLGQATGWFVGGLARRNKLPLAALFTALFLLPLPLPLLGAYLGVLSLAIWLSLGFRELLRPLRTIAPLLLLVLLFVLILLLLVLLLLLILVFLVLLLLILLLLILLLLLLLLLFGFLEFFL